MRTSGFTLIELLLIVLIIPILTTIGIARFNRQTASARLEAQADKMVDILELARSKTAARDLGTYRASCSGFDGYEVLINALDPQSYALKICCAGLCSQTVSTYPVEHTSLINITSPSLRFAPDNLLNGTVPAHSFSIRSEGDPAECVQVSLNGYGIVTRSTKSAC